MSCNENEQDIFTHHYRVCIPIVADLNNGFMNNFLKTVQNVNELSYKMAILSEKELLKHFELNDGNQGDI